MNNTPLVIVFSGYNFRAVLAFVRTLERNHVDYAIIARDLSDPIFLTDYASKVILVRKDRSLDQKCFVQTMQAVRESYGSRQCLIAPSTEALNRFILRAQTYLEGHGFMIPLVPERMYSRISDKLSFGKLCRQHGILVPGEYSSIEQAEYPFVAKPRTYFSDDGSIHTPKLIFDEHGKHAFSRDVDASQFYFQEFVTGRSVYLLYYFGKDGSITKLSQENLVQQPEGKSILAARTARWHQAPESALFENLFTDLGFFGLVMVELKIQGSVAYMIEANPRFWGPSQLFVDANVNLFEAFLYEHGAMSRVPDEVEYRDASYFWYGGLQSVLRQGAEPAFYGTTKDEFLSTLDTWHDVDIYNRKDSIGLYLDELK